MVFSANYGLIHNHTEKNVTFFFSTTSGLIRNLHEIPSDSVIFPIRRSAEFLWVRPPTLEAGTYLYKFPLFDVKWYIAFCSGSCLPALSAIYYFTSWGTRSSNRNSGPRLNSMCFITRCINFKLLRKIVQKYFFVRTPFLAVTQLL